MKKILRMILVLGSLFGALIAMVGNNKIW